MGGFQVLPETETRSPVILARSDLRELDCRGRRLGSSRGRYLSYLNSPGCNRLLAQAAFTRLFTGTGAAVNCGTQKLESHHQHRREFRESPVELIADDCLCQQPGIGCRKIGGDILCPLLVEARRAGCGGSFHSGKV